MIRISILAAILILFLAARGTDSLSPEEIDRHYRSLGRAGDHSNKKLLQSESMIRKAITQSGPPGPLTWRLARTYHRLGENASGETAKNYFRRCIEQAGRTIQLNNQSAGGFFYRGVCRGKLGKAQGIWKNLAAIKPLKRDLLAAVKYGPSLNQGGPHRALGKFYLELPGILGGSVDKSVHHLKQAVALGPEFADNYLFFAEALYERGNYRAAKDTLKDLLKIIEASSGYPDSQQVRLEIQMLMEKINPRIESPAFNAKRD